MLLGARQFFAARKAAPAWTNPYVTDGLIAMWDGEWNAGGGVHDAGATVWKDLVGTHDMTIVNGYWGVDCFVIGSQTTAMVTYCDETIEIQESTLETVGNGWFDGKDKRIGFYFSAAGGKGFLWFISTSDVKTYMAQFATYGYAALLQYDEFSHTITGITNRKSCTAAYVDAELSQASYSENWGGSPKLGIGRLDYGIASRYPTGRRNCIRLYNRALTADEIAANYAIDKQRFNLP